MAAENAVDYNKLFQASSNQQQKMTQHTATSVYKKTPQKQQMYTFSPYRTKRNAHFHSMYEIYVLFVILVQGFEHKHEIKIFGCRKYYLTILESFKPVIKRVEVL